MIDEGGKKEQQQDADDPGGKAAGQIHQADLQAGAGELPAFAAATVVPKRMMTSVGGSPTLSMMNTTRPGPAFRVPSMLPHPKEKPQYS